MASSNISFFAARFTRKKMPTANGLTLRSNDRDDSKGVKPFSDGPSGGPHEEDFHLTPDIRDPVSGGLGLLALLINSRFLINRPFCRMPLIK